MKLATIVRRLLQHFFSEENGRHYLARVKNSDAELGVKTLLVNNNMPVCQV